jgi:hypothetical protein
MCVVHIGWLDDVGLPQYKDAFAEARVDGRMLHYLTGEDLLALHVTSVLHHLSIKSAIQVLRMNDFHPTCFKRRPLPDDVSIVCVAVLLKLYTVTSNVFPCIAFGLFAC